MEPTNIKKLRLYDGTVIKLNLKSGMFTVDKPISSEDLLEILFNELWTLRQSTFACPDCGYKVQYEEFIESGEENAALN